ncbi:Uncharacterised protein [Vibrio cholerae]|nr:Uncharacterised protein [Vibrio cholerae]CSC80470.1 Uncharacterised protein [Vibrio cholerae]
MLIGQATKNNLQCRVAQRLIEVGPRPTNARNSIVRVALPRGTYLVVCDDLNISAIPATEPMRPVASSGSMMILPFSA